MLGYYLFNCHPIRAKQSCYPVGNLTETAYSVIFSQGKIGSSHNVLFIFCLLPEATGLNHAEERLKAKQIHTNPSVGTNKQRTSPLAGKKVSPFKVLFYSLDELQSFLLLKLGLCLVGIYTPIFTGELKADKSHPFFFLSPIAFLLLCGALAFAW